MSKSDEDDQDYIITNISTPEDNLDVLTASDLPPEGGDVISGHKTK